MKMILIPPGEFVMGNSREEIAWARTTWPGQVAIGVHDPAGRTWLEDAFPPHRVRITQPFYLGIHEVTQDAYERVMGVNPSGCKEPRHPVETVHWNDAVEFCHRLAALTRQKRQPGGCIDFQRRRSGSSRAEPEPPRHIILETIHPSLRNTLGMAAGGSAREPVRVWGSFLPLPHTRLAEEAQCLGPL